MDYLPTFGIPIFDPNNFALDAIRSICFDVFIVDDLLHEDVESFNISLELNTSIVQSGIIVDPSLTEIFILDNDGKRLCLMCTAIVSYISLCSAVPITSVSITSTTVPVTSNVPDGSLGISVVVLMVVGIVVLLGFAALFLVILLLILKIRQQKR